jgi:hypothetical protein
MTGMSLEMSELEFALWLKHSPPNSQIVYHRGNLARDRAGKFVFEGEAVKLVPTIYSEAVTNVASAVWRAMENHYILLTQHKAGEARFEYLATRTNLSRLHSRNMSPDE